MQVGGFVHFSCALRKLTSHKVIFKLLLSRFNLVGPLTVMIQTKQENDKLHDSLKWGFILSQKHLIILCGGGQRFQKAKVRHIFMHSLSRMALSKPYYYYYLSQMIG